MQERDEPELIGVTQAEVGETTVRGGAGSRSKAIAALVVATFVGFLALQMVNTTADDAPESLNDPFVSEVTGEDAQPDNEEVPAPTTSTSRPKRTTTTSPVISGEPLFGHETGWDLILGNDGMELTRLSIDSGSYQQFSRGYWPVGVVGDTLLVSGNSERLRYVRLSNLEERPEVLPGTMNPGFYGAYRLPLGGAENQAWLLGGSYEEQTWQLWDFTGEPTVIREFPAVPNNYGPPSMDPTIFGSPSGGVFEGEPGDLRRLADGRLVLSTPRHVVVEQCTDPFTCEVVWLDRVSGKRDSAVVAPPIGNASFLWAMNASADGRLVFVPDWETGKGFIWDLYEGEVVTDLFQEGASFSPDSRYAVGSLRSGNLGVIDFDTGEIAEWDVPGGRYYGGGVFIPAG